jgi:hypothetical protein
MQDAGREWFGAVCHGPSSGSTAVSFSTAMQRQLSDDPGGPRPVSLRRHTDNKAPAVDPCCSAPAGADRTDAGVHGTWQKSVAGPESPYRPFRKQTLACQLFLYPAPTFFQITPTVT